MRVFSTMKSHGFTLFELLVAISILLLLSSLLLVGLSSVKNHQVLDQAAARLVMMITLAQETALSENEPVYLVISDEDSLPAGVPLRSYTFIKNLQDPQLLHHWQFLPKDVYFREDPEGSEVDLMNLNPIEVIEDAFFDEAQGSQVTGDIRVLVEMTPESTFLSGPDRRPLSVSILLDRSFSSDVDEEESPEFEQFRISFRPLSGMVRLEEVLP